MRFRNRRFFRFGFGNLMVLACLFSWSVMAENQQAEPDPLLRLLPVGEAPPWEKRLNGQELPPPEGSIPPRQVVQIRAGGVQKGDPVRLRLDRLSAPIPIGPRVVKLHRQGIAGINNSKPWHTLKVPKGDRFLAVLWRDPKEGRWSKARSMTLRDDVTAFPAGSVRFVNVSPWTVNLSHDGVDVQLPPHDMLMLANVEEGEFQVRVRIKDEKWVKVYDSVLQQDAGERTNAIVYKADGVRPRMPVKMRVFREHAKLRR